MTFLAVCCLLSFASGLRAAVDVGDKPQIQFVAVDGTAVDVGALHGKIVVLDMWATWCGPCMAEAPHIVKINQTYAGKGLQILGISLDEDRLALIKVAQQQGFNWPQYYDGQGFQNKFAQMFGVNGIPFSVILGPDGAVLWTGHPANIDQPLADAFKNHPPQLVDAKVLKTAQDTLAQVEARLADNDTKGALQLLAKVPPEASSDPKFAAALGTTQKKVDAAAEAMLADVTTSIEAGQYAEAATRLKQLIKTLAGSPTARKAQKTLAELMAKPEVKKAIADADRNDQAEAALAVAQKLRDAEQDAAAYPRFKQIVTQYPGTAAADKATPIVAAYEADTAFIQKLKASDAGRTARAALSMAQTYQKSGKTDLAVSKYKQIVHDYPGSSHADAATQALAEMGESK